MSFEQIVLYHNKGLEMSNPQPPATNGDKPSAFKSGKEVRDKREELVRQGLIDDEPESDGKDVYREKYGDIG